MFILSTLEVRMLAVSYVFGQLDRELIMGPAEEYLTGYYGRVVQDVKDLDRLERFLPDGEYVPSLDELYKWWLELENTDRREFANKYLATAGLPPYTRLNPALRIPVLELV